MIFYKKFLPFLLAFVLPLVAVYAWWGGFNPVTLETTVRGPYTYAYLEQVGDYSGLPKLAAEAREELERAKRAHDVADYGQAISVLYSNPDVVDVGERRARTGFLVPPGTLVGEPLKVDSIPARPVLVVQVRAGSLLAPSRAYAALDSYLQARGSGIRMPTVELYEASGDVLHMGLFSVEMDTPADNPVTGPGGEGRR